MKYSELSDYLKRWIKGTVTEHEDGSISVDGDVYWDSKLWNPKRKNPTIPIKFRRVTGTFDCTKNRLTSLENAPDWVGVAFWCVHNQLTSLEYAPRYVGGAFWCAFNKLTSLDGLGEVPGKIHCHHNLVPEEELLAEYRRKISRKDPVGDSLAIKDRAAKLVEKLISEKVTVTESDNAKAISDIRTDADGDGFFGEILHEIPKLGNVKFNVSAIKQSELELHISVRPIEDDVPLISKSDALAVFRAAAEIAKKDPNLDLYFGDTITKSVIYKQNGWHFVFDDEDSLED